MRDYAFAAILFFLFIGILNFNELAEGIVTLIRAVKGK